MGYNDIKAYQNVTNKSAHAPFGRDTPLTDDETRRQRRAYMAAASFADAQLGKILDALEKHNLGESTVIAVLGDHGWHLGENNNWAKHTSMTRANRAPLLFRLPLSATTTTSRVVSGFVEFVDVFPTLK